MSTEKSFRPSARKLARSRKEGRVLRSGLVTQLAVLAAGFSLVEVFGGRIWVAPKMLLEYGLSNPSSAIGEVLEAAKGTVIQCVTTTVGVSALAGIVAEITQVGFSFEGVVLAPRMERINPALGLKRLGGALIRAWEPLSRVLIMFAVGAMTILSVFLNLASSDWSQISMVVIQGRWGLCTLVRGLLAAAAIVAAFDYLLRRREFYKELSMDHQEIREEHKELEGQPLVKALRRAMHESLAMQDVERRVRSAKVIIVRKAAASS